MALIGPHFQGFSDPAARWAKVAPIVKSIDSPAPFVIAPPDAIRLLRPFTGDNNRNVAEVLAKVDADLQGYRHPLLYVEPINEPLPWELADTIAFFTLITPELHARGLKVAGPSWSVGNPELDALRQWLQAGTGVDLLTFHAYWAMKGFTPWAAARPLRLIRESGFTGDWAITEGGRDDLSTPAFGEGGNGGWQKDGVSPEQYVRELLDFTTQNAAHPGFRGFTPFTAAPVDPHWFPYSTDPLVDLILAGQSPPPPDNGGVALPDQTAAQIAALEAKYGISHKGGATIYLAELIERTDPPSIVADGPADATVTVNTEDNLHPVSGKGHAEIAFNHDAAYVPTKGEHGFFYAACEDARVDGLGWAFGVPGDTAPHRNVAVRFARRSAPPPPPPPPADDGGFVLAFADYYRAHPEIGPATAGIAYCMDASGPPEKRPCIQVSASTVLVWNGQQVIALPRYR